LSGLQKGPDVSAPSSAAVEKLGETPVDRRERRPVSMHGFAMRADQSSVEVLLLDLSYEGCGIETPIAFECGEVLKLSVLRRGAIEARVRWCKDGKAGLVFGSDEALERQHSERKSDRKLLSAEVSMRRLGKLNYRVQVFDVSPTGCKVELVDRPRLGEHVLVKFDGLEGLEAEVCWIEGPCAGLRFERPIHPAVFDLLVERLG
jgi:hypothetical protein